MKAGSQLLPVGAVLTSILSLQFGAAFATTLFSQIGPAGATTLRLTIAAIILGVIVRPRWSRWSNRQRKGIFALGIALAVMNGAFYLALDTVPIGTAVTIEFLGPLTLAAVLSRRWADGAWVLLAFGGVLLLGLGDHGESGLDPIGVMFALIAATAWAGYIVAGSHLAATLPSADGLAGASIVAAVLTLPFGVVSGGSELLDPTMLAAGAAVAVLSSVIPYSLEMWALRSLAKKVFAVLIALEPAAAALAGVLVIGQTLDAFALVAIALVVAAGVGTVVMNRKPTAK
ncbi:EamA family transporter [Rhodococcus sp. 1.20]|jgi:inner membrane transporter RhtA|uniref:EamA family transporter n=1 Tax=Rhodococcus TaxID=1827 RepID=UPI000977B882|nr:MULTISPECIES: EamA family transporter [Rhodococcus]AUS31210.1 EamA family transporter [Rhodococcus qingshengii]MBW0285513.1 transporter [Rhodococcus sp. FH8]MCC4303672.1 EamA family transporter [Rhodococcus sp. 3-2]MCX6475707.1 EamA family transporter [Rhodococcus sp. (in: high G+C Gram-positive bacteria)]MDJ0489389.1 EamA family transporter [Rhodococcus qingshengii]